MKRNTQTQTPTPLELATDARVACVILEGEIPKDHRKSKQAFARLRKLWDTIRAMADVIEAQQAEIERLTLPMIGEVRVEIFETPEQAREFSEERLNPTIGVPIPADTETPEFVTETICETPAPAIIALPLGHRPPGFVAVRERMKRGPRRENPCRLHDEDEEKKARHKANGRSRGKFFSGALMGAADHGHEESTAEAIERAYDEKKFKPGRAYMAKEINRIVGRSAGHMGDHAMTLAARRSHVKMVESDQGWRFVNRFAEVA